MLHFAPRARARCSTGPRSRPTRRRPRHRDRDAALRQHARPRQGQRRLLQWHVMTVQWTPGKMVVLLDGKAWATYTSHVPSAPMHLVMQSEVGTNGFTGVMPNAIHPGEGRVPDRLRDRLQVQRLILPARPDVRSSERPARGFRASAPPPARARRLRHQLRRERSARAGGGY